MFDPFSGLPLHPLLVHVTVILVPVTGLLVAGTVVWPALRRWSGWLPGALGVLALGATLVTVRAGEEFERQLAMSVTEHAAAGRSLRWWVIALAVAGLAVSWWARRERSRHAVPRAVVATIVVVGLVAGLGSVVMTVRAGHTGAESVWGHVGNV